MSKNASAQTTALHEQLTRVQSANYSYTINRQDVNQYGQLARIDSLVLDPPTVSIDFSYYLTDGFNERVLDFYVQTGAGAASSDQGNFASGHMTAGSGVNVYVLTSEEGTDFNLQTSAEFAGSAGATKATVVGVGNCYLSDYSIDLSVGSLPTASVTMEGANMAATASGALSGVAAISGIVNPSVNQEDGVAVTSTPVVVPAPSSGNVGQPTALRPGDITLDIAQFAGQTITDLTDPGACNVQSCSLSIPLSRSPLDRLGSKFPFARTVDFPVVTTLSVSALLNEEVAYNLSTGLDGGQKDVTITMKTPALGSGIQWQFKNALVESENWSSSIGSNKSVDLTFTAQVGGPEDLTAGVFMSGASIIKAFGA